MADLPTGPHKLHSISLSVANETIVVAFRRHTLLPLDDCLHALQATIPHLTRSSLHRCLQRHGISHLPDVGGGKPARKACKAYPVGFFHIDIAEGQTAEGKLHLFVGIDRTSKFAFVQLAEKASRVTASALLVELIKAVLYRIHAVLTDNGIQFRLPPRYADGPTAQGITHMFDLRCRENGIEHRFIKINHPWTNRQVERMNRTIKEAVVQRYHYEAQSPHRPKNGQLVERKVYVVSGSWPGTAGHPADGCAVGAEQPGDVCGRAACVQHGEHFGLLLGGEFGLPAAVATLSTR